MRNNLYDRHQFRLILDQSRKSTSIEDFKKRLEKRGIHAEIKNHPAKKMDVLRFKKREFELSSNKGKDRQLTDIARKNILKNIEKNKTSQIIAPEYSRFAEIRKNRELKTNLERQSMYNIRGLKK